MASNSVVDLVPHSQAAIVPTAQQSVFMPVMSMEVALQRRKAIVDFTKQIMVSDQDYGAIPGTNKPTLLKPGAEKLCNFFGLEPDFIPIVEDADWTGELHNGEPFYYVRYRCRLLRDGRVLGVGEGSCNSWESKYRWREGKRKCPKCGIEAIFASKHEPGFYCWAKKGGCGAKFGPDDPSITGQQVGRVPNPDVADVVNTIQKMAQKRALVAATLIATSASEFFTQDVEDMPDTGGHPVGTQAAANHVGAQKLSQLRQDPAELKALLKKCTSLKAWGEVSSDLYEDIKEAVGDDAAMKTWDRVLREHGDPALKWECMEATTRALFIEASQARDIVDREKAANAAE